MEENKDKVFMDMAQGAKNAVTKVRLKSQLVEDTAERYGLSSEDDIEALMRECYKKEMSKEYLVHGAILTCTNCTKKDVTVCVEGKNYIYHAKEKYGISAESIDEYDEQKVYGKLEVGENFDISVEGLSYATIKDFVIEKNIPYFGNCLSSPYLAQCMKETNKGNWLREGEYKQWNSQQEYEDYYNNNTKYKYLYRGAGYIQMTWDYSYLAFATFMIKQESGISDIEWKSPANESKGFEERYEAAVEKAEAVGMNVDAFKKIVSEGADYVAEEFAWEAAGYDWYVKGLNSIVDDLEPENKDGADAVTYVVNRYTPQKSYEDRRDYYEETINVIK